MNALRAIALALWVLLLALPAAAVIETYEFSEPELEKRYRELSQELRCPDPVAGASAVAVGWRRGFIAAAARPQAVPGHARQ